jgi:hypothetical protein
MTSSPPTTSSAALGSPVVDKAGAVIGAAFDGNIHSSAAITAMTADNRTVVV